MEQVRLEVTVNRKTEKAWLIWIEGGASLKNPGATWQTYWLPDSAVVETDCLAEGDKGYMVVKRRIVDKHELVPDPPKQTTTDEMAELEDQLQEARGDSERLEVVVGVDPDQLARGQGDIQINAYLTDEGLVVDVFHGDSDEAIASGYEFFSEAGLHPPEPIEQPEEEEDF
jgi:hypothetical protein